MDALLFDKLLDILEREHFTISVTHRLRVYQLALSLREPVDLRSLGPLLRPLLATSREQQEKFDRLYEEYLQRGERPGGRTTKKDSRDRDANEERDPRVDTNRRLSMTMIAVISTIVIALALFVICTDRIYENCRTDSGGTTGVSSGTDTANTTTSTTTIADTAPTTTTTTTTTATTTQESSEPKERPVRAALRSAKRLLQGLGALLAGMLLFDIARVAARRTLRREVRGRKLPYRWPLQSADVTDAFDTPAVDDAVRRLRRRAAGERTQLDLVATVRATATAGRLATFVHTAARQSPRYVALIERHSEDDHLTAYFHAAIDALRVREVELDAYEFNGDPRICIDPRILAPIGIGEVRERHPGSRLLLLGTCNALVDPFTGSLHDWVEEDLDWRVRGALLPDWTGGGVERELASTMAVARGDAEGLLQLADMLDRGEHVRHRASPASPGAYDALLGANPSVRELRSALDEQTFRWLAACALPVSLSWDITIRLGRLLLGTIDDRRLLQLARLRWFRAGAIPDARREELIDVFRPDRMFAQAHFAIAGLLAERKPPPHTYAAEVHSMRAVTHRILASPPDSPALRTHMRELRSFSTDLVRGNDDLAPMLAPPAAAPRLSRIVFRGGTPTLGVRNFVGTAALTMFALLLAGTTVARRASSYADPQKGVPRPTETTTTIAERTETYGPPPPIVTTTTVQATGTYGPSTPPGQVTTVTPPPPCEVRIKIGERWLAQFTNCAGTINTATQWRLNVARLHIWLEVSSRLPGKRFLIEPVDMATQRPATVTTEWRRLSPQARGTLTIGSVSYPALLEAGPVADNFAGLLARAAAESRASTCTGALTRVSADVANVFLDEQCAGPIRRDMTGVLIAGSEVIDVVVIPPNMPADRVGENVVVATLRLSRDLGREPRTFLLRLGEKSYTVTIGMEQTPPEPPEPTIPSAAQVIVDKALATSTPLEELDVRIDPATVRPGGRGTLAVHMRRRTDFYLLQLNITAVEGVRTADGTSEPILIEFMRNFDLAEPNRAAYNVKSPWGIAYPAGSGHGYNVEITTRGGALEEHDNYIPLGNITFRVSSEAKDGDMVPILLQSQVLRTTESRDPAMASTYTTITVRE